MNYGNEKVNGGNFLKMRYTQNFQEDKNKYTSWGIQNSKRVLGNLGLPWLVCKRHFKKQTVSDKTNKIIFQQENNA